MVIWTACWDSAAARLIVPQYMLDYQEIRELRREEDITQLKAVGS